MCLISENNDSRNLDENFSSSILFDQKFLDLNKELIPNPSSTYFGRVSGHSLKNAGIEDGDLMIIDKSIVPDHGKIAICFLNGEFTAKRIDRSNGKLWLMPENVDYDPIEVNEEDEFQIWGIVLKVIKSV